MLLLVIIVALSLVQSLFGIGLLVFGTPTLLLLGYPFAQVLAILLPASLTVSLLQVWHGGAVDRGFLLQFTGWCLVPLAVALTVTLALDLRTSLDLLVAIALASFALLRLYPRLGRQARTWVADHPRPWLALMGVVHGASNLGGGLLTIFAAARHQSKDDIRRLIALCYSCFAASQLLVLALVVPSAYSWSQLSYAALSAAVYLVVGQRVFGWISAPAFDRLLTVFIAAYSGMLWCRFAGWL